MLSRFVDYILQAILLSLIAQLIQQKLTGSKINDSSF
jgi:hypothetical protein